MSSGGAESSEWKSVERGAPGDAGVKTVKRKRAMQSNRDWSLSSNKRVDTRVEHGGKHRVPTDHVESRGADDNGHPAVERATSAISREAGNDSPRSEN